eukprot:1158419-Pelagomonas_calceolata.AAC.13
MDFVQQSSCFGRGNKRFTVKGKKQSQHFRHADTNLANPRTPAWFMKSLRRDALLGGAELNRKGKGYIAALAYEGSLAKA